MTANLVALVVATSVLVSIPGPNVALIVANSLKYGLRTGLATVVGTTTGMAMQLALVVLGMVAVLEYATVALTWVRWLGVAYLIYLGIRTWRQPAADLSDVEAVPAMFWRGCMLAAVNPKSLVFIAAFFPQFIVADVASSWQVVLTGTVFLAVVFAGDALWAVFAHSASRFIAKYAVFRNRLTGAFLAAAGVGLALARK